MADELDRKRTKDPKATNAKWVKALSTNANKGRFAQWSKTAPGSKERTALEAQFEAEDRAEEAARQKTKDDEAERQRQVMEARERLRGAG